MKPGDKIDLEGITLTYLGGDIIEAHGRTFSAIYRESFEKVGLVEPRSPASYEVERLRAKEKRLLEMLRRCPHNPTRADLKLRLHLVRQELLHVKKTA